MLNSPNHKFKIFGIYRFFLALLVVIGHYHFFLPEEASKTIRLFNLGNVAVMTFFVISGYIMAEANNIFYQNKTLKFIQNRALRIMPLFIVALFLSVIIHFIINEISASKLINSIRTIGDYENLDFTYPKIFTIENLASNFLRLIIWDGLNYLFSIKEHYIFVRYAWAIFIELKFYVLIAIFYILYYRYNKKIIAIIFTVIFSILPLFIIIENIKYSILNFSPFFLTGVFLYYYILEKNILILIGGLGNFSLSIYSLYTFLDVGGENKLFLLVDCFLYSIFTWFIYYLSKFQGTNFVIRIDKILGDLSYPMYINQYAIQIFFLSYQIIENKTLNFIGAIVTLMTVAFIINTSIESKIKIIRNKNRGFNL